MMMAHSLWRKEEDNTTLSLVSYKKYNHDNLVIDMNYDMVNARLWHANDHI